MCVQNEHFQLILLLFSYGVFSEILTIINATQTPNANRPDGGTQLRKVHLEDLGRGLVRWCLPLVLWDGILSWWWHENIVAKCQNTQPASMMDDWKEITNDIAIYLSTRDDVHLHQGNGGCSVQGDTWRCVAMLTKMEYTYFKER